MIDIMNSDIGTGCKTTVRNRMFIFADYSVSEEYEDFMQSIETDNRYEILEVQDNFDMQGTLTKIVTYKVIGE